MVAFVNKTPEDEIHFTEKWLEFSKECKTVSTKQEIASDAAFKA